MRAYLANRMTGVPQMNFKWFDHAAAYLRVNHGIDVVSPAELDDPETRAAALASEHGDLADTAGHGTWGEFLARDVKLIVDDNIDAVIVGPDWALSKGARLETFIAHLTGKPVLNYPNLEPVTLSQLAVAWAGSIITIDCSVILESQKRLTSLAE